MGGVYHPGAAFLLFILSAPNLWPEQGQDESGVHHALPLTRKHRLADLTRAVPFRGAGEPSSIARLQLATRTATRIGAARCGISTHGDAVVERSSSVGGSVLDRVVLPVRTEAP